MILIDVDYMAYMLKSDQRTAFLKALVAGKGW